MEQFGFVSWLGKHRDGSFRGGIRSPKEAVVWGADVRGAFCPTFTSLAALSKLTLRANVKCRIAA